jgi:hypothetical protein
MPILIFSTLISKGGHLAGCSGSRSKTFDERYEQRLSLIPPGFCCVIDKIFKRQALSSPATGATVADIPTVFLTGAVEQRQHHISLGVPGLLSCMQVSSRSTCPFDGIGGCSGPLRQAQFHGDRLRFRPQRQQK